MLKIVAKNYVKLECKNAFVEAVKELIEETRKEKGCIKYELFEDTNQQDVLTFIEEWESQEDLKNHSNSTHFTRIVPKLGEFTSKPMEISVYKKLI